MPSSRRTFLAGVAGSLAAVSGCLSFDQPTADGSWPRRSIDNAHTGAAPTTGPTTNLHTEWYRDPPERRTSVASPVVGDGTLYAAYSSELGADEPGRVWVAAFDAATGEPRWTTELWRTHTVYDDYHSDSLVLDGDRLFVQTKVGLSMLDTTGSVQWTFDNLPETKQLPAVAPPIVTDDVVVTGSFGTGGTDGQHGTVYGIDRASGDERWRTAIPEFDHMYELVAANGVAYVPFHTEGLLALDLATGEELWRWALPVDDVPTVVDGTLLVTFERTGTDAEVTDRLLAALDLADRTIEWRVPVGVRFANAGTAVAGDLAFHVADLGVEARRLASGDRVWRFGGQRNEDGDVPHGTPEIDVVATPVVAGDAVYVPGWIQRDTSSGHLFVLDAASGTELARAELGPNRRVGSGVPAITSDLAFAGSNRGDLYAFGECDTQVAGRCLVD